MTMKHLVCLLTSKDPEKLKRSIESVIPQTKDVVVVCNTLDSSYEQIATLIAESYGLQCIVTESIGTPAKGKNSVLEYFLSTDYDYLTQVDADDYLTPDAISKIHQLIEQQPDVIGITNNYMTFNGKEYTAQQFFGSPDIYSFAGISGADALSMIALGKFMAANLKYNRMLLYSRKCVESFRFDETFFGSEDVIASYKLYYDPNLKYLLTDEHLYVYDLEEGGNFQSFLSNPTEVKRVRKELVSIVNGRHV